MAMNVCILCMWLCVYAYMCVYVCVYECMYAWNYVKAILKQNWNEQINIRLAPSRDQSIATPLWTACDLFRAKYMFPRRLRYTWMSIMIPDKPCPYYITFNARYDIFHNPIVVSLFAFIFLSLFADFFLFGLKIP